MAHEITYEQLIEAGFEGNPTLYESGGEMVFGESNSEAIFVSKTTIGYGDNWNAYEFQGVENIDDLKTLIKLIYGKANNDGSGNRATP